MAVVNQLHNHVNLKLEHAHEHYHTNSDWEKADRNCSNIKRHPHHRNAVEAVQGITYQREMPHREPRLKIEQHTIEGTFTGTVSILVEDDILTIHVAKI